MRARAGTFVDSSVLLDVFTADRRWLEWSRSRLIEALAQGPLVIDAVVFAEISPRFPRIEDLKAALPERMLIEELPREAAFLAGHAHSSYRRAGGAREQILADFLIASHAAVTGRPLLTRDPRRVSTYLPGVRLISP
ncbi:MAG TPA: type II toxin-antitoxin system VapC family toxin [Solirubrobacterales bacterium]|nr:type II toxin-antitoxin system VapC family toxin [Solirubrobacterales bacterium]